MSGHPGTSYRAEFTEERGYLNFASYGPPSRTVIETAVELLHVAAGGAVGARDVLQGHELRARSAFSRLSGFPLERVTLVPHTSFGLFQVAFGITGGPVLVGSGEFPANLYPWHKAEGRGGGEVLRVGTPGDFMTAEIVERSLTPDTVALAVSAVDFRTGYRADLAAIREVLGPDRLLVVDGIQGFGVLDQDWTVADALIVGGQKWIRGGWGAGALALSEAGLDRIRPVLGGWSGVQEAADYDGALHAPLPGALRFSMSNLSPTAVGPFAAALELIETATVPWIEAQVGQAVERLLADLDAAGVRVVSAVEPAHRAGIVVAGIPGGMAAAALADLADAGMTATQHGSGRIRLSPHVTTPADALAEAAGILGRRASSGSPG